MLKFIILQFIKRLKLYKPSYVLFCKQKTILQIFDTIKINYCITLKNSSKKISFRMRIFKSIKYIIILLF